MSKYTTEVRFICETESGLTKDAGIYNIIDASRPHIFNYPYPIFDEAYRPVLENKILMHYYTREIAYETAGLWKFKLNVKMNEIMPLYNEWYKSALLTFDPLHDMDLTTTHQLNKNSNNDIHDTTGKTNDTNRMTSGNINENGSRSGSGSDNEATQNSENMTSSSNDRYSDTPQGSLTNIEQDHYLTNARLIGATTQGSSSGTTGKTNNWSDSSENAVTNSTSGHDWGREDTNYSRSDVLHSVDDYVQHIVGKTAGMSSSKLLQEFRDTFVNIDMMVIKDLANLFFMLY